MVEPYGERAAAGGGEGPGAEAVRGCGRGGAAARGEGPGAGPVVCGEAAWGVCVAGRVGQVWERGGGDGEVEAGRHRDEGGCRARLGWFTGWSGAAVADGVSLGTGD